MEAEKVATMLTEHENRIKVSEHRISDLEDKTNAIEALTLSVQKLALSVESMAKEQIEYRTKQNDLAKRILDVERAPEKDKAKRHDEVIETVTKCIISAVVGAFIAYIGLQ